MIACGRSTRDVETSSGSTSAVVESTASEESETPEADSAPSGSPDPPSATEMPTRILVSRGPVYILLELRLVQEWTTTNYEYRALFQTPGKPALPLFSGSARDSQLETVVSGTRLASGRLALLAHNVLGFELADGSFALTKLEADPPDPHAREALEWVIQKRDPVLRDERRSAVMALVELGDRKAVPVLEEMMTEEEDERWRPLELAAAHARLTRDPRELADFQSLLRAPDYLSKDQIDVMLTACPPGLLQAAPRIEAALGRRRLLDYGFVIALSRCGVHWR